MINPRPAFDRARLLLAAGGFALLALLLAGRLVQLQSFRHRDAARRVEAFSEERVELPAPRGSITDRWGRPLAVARKAASVYLDPRMGRAGDAPAVAAALGLPVAKVAAAYARENRFVWLKRGAPEAEWLALSRQGLPGVGMFEETVRDYPQGPLAGALLGRVGRDNTGLSGVELVRQEQLAGSGGLLAARRDARGRLVEWREVRPVREGADVTLTLDAALQFRAESELATAMASSGARGGLVAVMNPDSGDLLAMASWPPHDPAAGGAPAGNPVAQMAYEPGSTFKAFTMIAALAEKKTRRGERINCLNGSITINGQVIRDHKPFGVLTIEEILAESSDVGVMQLGLRVGAERFEHYIRAFGFGARTGSGLPGESAGILAPRARWSGRTLPTLSMGQEISVSPLQLLSAYSAIATRGALPRPRFTMADPVNRVRVGVDPAVLGEVAEMLTGVVDAGTGGKAALPGIRVAGKTGTAQKAEGGRYLVGRYIASFIGFFPLERPTAVVLVVIDEPRGAAYHGGDVPAQVFGALARDIYVRSLAVRAAPAPGVQVAAAGKPRGGGA